MTQRSTATRRQWGDGSLLAVVMSPVMPVWDEGRFFEPMIAPLVKAGYRVLVFDTLSLLDDADESLPAFAQRWHAELTTLGHIDLLAGSALGGALVQSLLGLPIGQQIGKVLLLSSPALADGILDGRLGRMADLAQLGELERALQLLDEWVQPASRIQPSGPIEIDPVSAALQARRLHLGFRLLNRLDVRQASEAFGGSLLTVYGEQSQLVRSINVHTHARARQHRLAIPGGGMRPLLDAPGLVLRSVREHLGIDLEVAA
ncbi:alpha/beta hydrolase [Pseudomonas sp. NyZ201]|uniref:alpha/beta hydrolase n=1 Tax=Pseudomonas sp. NyZ201 TaxID=3409857 RepID=UPI003CE9CA63